MANKTFYGHYKLRTFQKYLIGKSIVSHEMVFFPPYSFFSIAEIIRYFLFHLIIKTIRKEYM